MNDQKDKEGVNLEHLLQAIQPLSTLGAVNREIHGVVCDSRQVRPGYLFVAIPGTKEDGGLFIQDALDKGAVAIVSESADAFFSNSVTEKKLSTEVALITVEDARSGLAGLSSAFNEYPSEKMRAIAVTGTNGKTTITFMVRNILRSTGYEPGMISTVEYEIGARKIPAARTTPEAPVLQSMMAQMVGIGCRSVVMEVSSHALVQKRTEGIDFDVGIFTNLTRDHLDYHHTMEEYFGAKSQLFSSLGNGNKEATAVINIDDPWGRQLAERRDLNARILTYSLTEKADVRADAIQLTPSQSRFFVDTPWGQSDMETPLMGKFNISNILAAIAACGVVGVDLASMKQVLKNTAVVPGRLERVPTQNGVLVFVDYAHTDDALQRVLEALREVSSQRIILVFGCGGGRDKSKRPAMGRVASQMADYSVLTSDNPRGEDPEEIIRGIRSGFETENHCQIMVNRDQAIAAALEMAQKGDIVLIAGKGHETFQEIGNRTVPFDDRQVVRKYS